MKNSILVSVIIPAYNCSKTIRQAIDSALLQDVSCEIIVIDDCSKEKLDQVLAEYKDNNAVRIYKNEVNMGVAKSRNRGVELARGEYVAYLDSDDVWKPGKLGKQIKLIESTGAALCCTARELMKEDGTLTGKVIHVPELITYKMLLKGNDINCSSVLMKKTVAKEFPMESDDAHEDYIAWLQILEKYEYAVALDEPMLIYRVVKNSKSGSKIKSAKMTYMVYKKMGFSTAKSVSCFTGYAINGIKKYIRH